VKQLKKAVLGALALFALALACGGYWLYGNLDAMVKRAIGHYGSQMTRAQVRVESVQLHTTDGSGRIRGLVIGNPAGFRSAHALKVAVIELQVDIRTLGDPVVVVKRIVIDAPDVIYEKGERWTNFEAIQRNIAQSLASGAANGASSTASPGRRLIVDELVIRHARAHATSAALMGQSVSATLPDIVLHRLGRDEAGLTPAQLGERVTGALRQRLIASLGVEQALKSLGKRIKDLFGH
jgi:hypothetical protein